MKELKGLFGRAEIQLFVFVVFALLLSWPFISMPSENAFAFFIYVYVIWILMLVVLFVISRSINR